jgi:hypothetical protein
MGAIAVAAYKIGLPRLAGMEDLPAYLMHDQPTTCPECGRRTEWFGEDPQIHLCICGYHFLVYEDEDFGLVETEHGWIPELEALAELDFEDSLASQGFQFAPQDRHTGPKTTQ